MIHHLSPSVTRLIDLPSISPQRPSNHQIRPATLSRSAQALAAQLPLQPRQIVHHLRVQPRQIRARTSASPRHQPNHLHTAADALHVQRTAAVALARVPTAIMVAGAHHVRRQPLAAVARLGALLRRPHGQRNGAQHRRRWLTLTGPAPAGDHSHGATVVRRLAIGQTGGLHLRSEPNRPVELQQRNVVVERHDVEARVAVHLADASLLGVVDGDVVAAEVYLCLARARKNVNRRM